MTQETTRSYRVTFNAHKYFDFSDTPDSRQRIVLATSPDEAREIVRSLNKSGQRYIGMVHTAEDLQA